MTPTSVIPYMLPSGTPYFSSKAAETAAGTSSPPVVIRLNCGNASRLLDRSQQADVERHPEHGGRLSLGRDRVQDGVTR